MRRPISIVSAFAAGALCLGGVAFTTANLRAQAVKQKGGESRAQGKMEMMSAAPTISKAVAVLHATKMGGEASGTVTFTKVDGGVRVEAEIKGLTPGMHGFHIHEFGDTSSPDAMSAGGHFNPGKTDHGAPGAGKHHVGDLGNIEANAKGTAKVDMVDPTLGFYGPGSIIGRGLIVHEKADDLKTQPTGNAGGRVAAGVIGVGKSG